MVWHGSAMAASYIAVGIPLTWRALLRVTSGC
jgi:hypothetical protein